MSDKEIKYIGLQMLTGGMYFGTEAAIGHPAELMISYPGFDAPKFNKDGKLVDAGNEYNLIEYLKKKGRMVSYYQFDRAPFQDDMDVDNVQLIRNGEKVDTPEFSNIDLVVAVPVCSGLSSATRGASAETLNSRNCNMLFLANYTLSNIKPKVYIFENAPRLLSVAGIDVRKQLEKIADKYGYAVAYYKTDTYWHDNCQKRPRTFVYFFKKDENHPGIPVLGFEHKHITVKELLDRIPEGSSQQFTVNMHFCNEAMLRFAKKIYNGNDWRTTTKSSTVLCDIISDNRLDEWAEFVNTDDQLTDKQKESIIRGINHMKNKMAQGLGFYTTSPTIMRKDTMPACMFKTIPSCMHYSEDRLYTFREWLTTMGMPYDFEMYGEPNRVFAKIGQNVPARTAQFIVSEAARVIKNWDSVERLDEKDVAIFDNIKQAVISKH